MRPGLFVAAAALLVLGAPSARAGADPTAAEVATRQHRQALNEIAVDLQQRKLAEAVAKADALIAEFDAAYAGDKRRIYCARDSAETLAYMLIAASDGQSAIALDATWSTALFLKGFALIDLHRSDEAGPLLERAVALSPSNAQFLAELGEWHKSRRRWDAAFAHFERAADASAFSPEAAKAFDKGRALRGMGFVLIELGKFDEAERRFHEALELNPNDAGAKGELDYIATQRGRLPRT